MNVLLLNLSETQQTTCQILPAETLSLLNRTQSADGWSSYCFMAVHVFTPYTFLNVSELHVHKVIQ